jgi:HAD superfamily hydrolase (TIGR01490 family)
MQRLAIYDMDKTITRKATFAPFISHVIRRYSPLSVVLVPVMAVLTLCYALGLLSRTRLKEWNLALLVGRYPKADHLRQIAQSFARETLDKNVLPAALARIMEDRNAGYRIIIASASYRFYVDVIAERLGIVDVVATELVGRGAGAYAAKIAGKNCYDAEKLVMVKDWLTREGLTRQDCHIRFYSDHISDVPCLTWADEAFATNPHPALQKVAAANGWKPLDWMSPNAPF